MAKAKRGNAEGSVYQRKDGLWCGAVSGMDGKRKVVYGKTRQDASRKLTDLLKTVQDGRPVTRNERLTVRTYLTDWLENTAKPRMRPLTYRSVHQKAMDHIVPELGRLRLSQLDTPAIQRLLNRKHASGLAPKTVKHVRDVLRTALNDALDARLVTHNPAIAAKPPRAIKFEVRPLTLAEAQALLKATQSHRLRALFTVALALGLRAGEALGLRWEDVELETAEPVLHIRHALQRLDGEFRLVEPKTASSRRSIPLPPVAVAALREHKRAQLKDRLAAGHGLWHDDFGLVFTRKDGSPVLVQNLTRTFQALLTQAGLPQRRFHDLRHACCSLLLAQGVPPGTVMEILGHSSLVTTMSIYREVSLQAQREGLTKMEFLAPR